MALLTITLRKLAKFVLPIFMTLDITDLESLASKVEFVYEETQPLAH